MNKRSSSPSPLTTPTPTTVTTSGGVAPPTAPRYHPATGPRGRYGPIKRKKTCIDLACHPSFLFLTCTIATTVLASVLLSYALTGSYWEMLNYDMDKVNEVVANNKSYHSIEWLFHQRVPIIRRQEGRKKGAAEEGRMAEEEEPKKNKFLLPLHSGVWISCIDLQDAEFKDLQELGYERVNKCVDHLDPDFPKPTDARASWQHRMQNLAVACAYVCLILLGAAVLVGLFGILRPQNSAVLVTGVIYVLSATFALFTLTIVHFKHKNRDDLEPLDVWIRLIPELGDIEADFRSARIISHGGSLQLAWAGSGVCVLASIMWIALSKMMRYNPISFRN